MVNLPSAYDYEEKKQLPPLRWCGHPSHVDSEFRESCEKWGDRQAAIPERKPLKTYGVSQKQLAQVAAAMKDLTQSKG